MSKSPSLRFRLMRTVGVTAVLGVAATTASFVVVRGDVDRINQKRIDRPTTEALLRVEHLNAEVDQVLATANGAVAANDGDPKGFKAVLGPDVRSDPTLVGMALVTKVRGQPARGRPRRRDESARQRSHRARTHRVVDTRRQSPRGEVVRAWVLGARGPRRGRGVPRGSRCR